MKKFLFLFLLFLPFCSKQEPQIPSTTSELNAKIQGLDELWIQPIPDSLQGVAPNFNATDLSNQDFELSEQLGKVVVINFWGTWCAPCIAELPEFIHLQKEYSKDDLVFVGVSTPNESSDSVKAFVEEIGINYPIIYDKDEMIINLFFPASWPSTYLIGKDGKLKYIIRGATTKDLLRPVLDELL